MEDEKIKTIIEDAERIIKIAKETPDQITGYNHEDSKYNKGINITLKRPK